MEKSGKVTLLKGIVLGLIVGAVVGIFTAPKSGKESRAAVADGAKKASDKTVDYYRKLEKKVRKAEKTADEAQEETQDLEAQVRELQSALTSLKKQIK